MIRRTPVTPVRSAAGRVGAPIKLCGKVTLGNQRIQAPLSGRDVACYRIVVEEYIADGQFLPVAEARQGSLLRLSEGDHSVDVVLDGSAIDVHLPEHTRAFDISALTPEQAARIAALTRLGKLPAIGRVTETSLGESDAAYVFGTPRQQADVAILGEGPYRDAPPPSALITNARIADEERTLAAL